MRNVTAVLEEKMKELKLSEEEKERLLMTGIDLEGKDRSGSFFLCDHQVSQCMINQDGLELLPIQMALEKYDLKDYYWKLLQPEKDPFTKRAEEDLEGGYFIRALPGAKIIFPVQACLFITIDKFNQDVHNLIIAEEGSELHVITGCSTSPHVRSGLHVGVSEFYVKRGAKLTFTMIHTWPEEMLVRPRTMALVEEEGTFISNYITLLPAKDIQAYPTAILHGKNSVATFQSVLLARKGSFMDLGSRAILKAEGARAEIISRSVSTGGTVIARGHLVGEATGVKGHLECRGLLLSSEGAIHAIPELEARAEEVEMSHEAAVGKIAREELEYLMARGLNEEEATSLIIKGFLTLEVKGLPPLLKAQLDALYEEMMKKAL